MQCQQLQTGPLFIDHWQVDPGECWVVLGRNGSGKKALGQFLADPELPHQGSYIPPTGRVAILSFESQQAFYERELKLDMSDYMDYLDPGTTVADILGMRELPASFGFLGLEPLLDRGYRLLSSGESRKVLLARALLEKPDYLILDEPYDSLDNRSKKELNDFLEGIRLEGHTTLLFLLNTFEEISPWMERMAVLEKGRFIASGETAELIRDEALHALLAFDARRLPAWPADLPSSALPDPLLCLSEGHVRYGDTSIFEHINLTVHPGDHTLLTGRNGSGKSTLLNLFSGDHPQCYGNDLQILGFVRGSGETVWEIKQRIGIVSPGLHRDHRVPGTALQIVVSGFFDTIGLYDAPSEQQLRDGRSWLALVGLDTKSSVAFKQLSYGEQRLCLIARALVKQPALLLLDEPSQGLDEINRHRLLYFLEHLASQQRTTIIMATHRLDEHLSLFTHHIHLP